MRMSRKILLMLIFSNLCGTSATCLAQPVKTKKVLSKSLTMPLQMVPLNLVRWQHEFDRLVAKRVNEFLSTRTDLPDKLSCDVSCTARRDGRVLNVQIDKHSASPQFDSIVSSSIDALNEIIPKFSSERILIRGKCIKNGQIAVFKTDKILQQKDYFGDLGPDGYKKFNDRLGGDEVSPVGDFWPRLIR